MNSYDLIKKRRSIRKFKQDVIKQEVLEKIVDGARYAPSGANLQPIKYIVIKNPQMVKKVFPLTKWAAYVSPKRTPKIGETPTAYIAILIDENIRKDGDNDACYATSNMIYIAESYDIGSCIIGSLNREELKKLLKIEDNLRIHSVLALGYKGEEPILEDAKESIKYYLDENDSLHVPKRILENICEFI